MMNSSLIQLYKIFRFGLGRFSTVEEVDYTADRTIKNVKRLRDMR